MPADCLSDDAFFYAQYTCIQTNEALKDKYFQISTTIAICCLIAYLFTISLRHLYQGDKIRQLEWDMATITAGDYTVELKIDKSHYLRWKESVYKRPGGDFENKVSPAMSLKNHLIEEIE